MRFLALFLSISLASVAFADRPVQSARMGKVGSLHPKSWRISEAPDKKGEGEFYSFALSLYKAGVKIDSFKFSLNEGSKNTKKSSFSLQGDAGSEKFGTEVSLEFLSKDPFSNKMELNILLKSKVFKEIYFEEKSHKASFIYNDIEDRFLLSQESPIKIEGKEDISIKIEIEPKN